jgi:hypothetical protein
MFLGVVDRAMFEQRSNITSSGAGFVFISLIGLVLICVIPYTVIIYLSDKPLYIPIFVGVLLQVVGATALTTVVRPIVEFAIHQFGVIRNVISHSSEDLRTLIKNYIRHKKTSDPVVVNVEVDGEVNNGNKKLNIEFISETQYGVFVAELSDLKVDDATNLSFTDKKNTPNSEERCTLSPNGQRTRCTAPIFDSTEEDTTFYSRVCEGCLMDIMDDVGDTIEEDSTDVVANMI